MVLVILALFRMSMTVIAPPEPPRLDELEALIVIEEARRRTRRRRLAYIVATLLAVAIGCAVWAGLAFRGGDATTAGRARPGFRLVTARGPVAHQLIETWNLPQPTSVDLATGQERPARTTQEVWVDRDSGLWRIVARINGRIQSDRVDPGTGRPLPSQPDALLQPVGFSFGHFWPLAHQYGREPGTETFRGRKVIWVGKTEHGFPLAPRDGQRVGLDARTHDPLVYRSFLYGAVVSQSWVRAQMQDVPGSRFSLAVPVGSTTDSRPAMRYEFFAVPASTPFGARARSALGRTPLWLGWRFHGQRIHSITIGSEVIQGRNGARLSSAKFVRYDYGIVSLEEFGSQRPSWYEQGPRPGYVVLETLNRAYELGPGPRVWPKVDVLGGQRAALTRGGVLAVITSPDARRYSLNRASAMSLARELRPVPPT